MHTLKHDARTNYESAQIIDGWLLLGASNEFDAIPLVPAGDG